MRDYTKVGYTTGDIRRNDLTIVILSTIISFMFGLIVMFVGAAVQAGAWWFFLSMLVTCLFCSVMTKKTVEKNRKEW